MIAFNLNLTFESLRLYALEGVNLITQAMAIAVNGTVDEVGRRCKPTLALESTRG